MAKAKPLLVRVADTLRRQRSAWRDCRWQEWANGKPALCHRAGCQLQACAEPRQQHLPRCRYGDYWEPSAGTHPRVGAPCSPACAEHAALIAELEAPQQGVLL